MIYHKHRCVNCVNCVNRFVLSLARRLPSPLSSSQSEAAEPSLRRAKRPLDLCRLTPKGRKTAEHLAGRHAKNRAHICEKSIKKCSKIGKTG